MQKEASTRYETTKSKLIMMKNTFQNLQTEIGAALPLFVSKLAEAFSALAKRFQGLSSNTVLYRRCPRCEFGDPGYTLGRTRSCDVFRRYGIERFWSLN
ncbi:hypothetical protein [Paenibacillus larvae]|uniref:hypothetical protein n=1 Tax=Paenibacillus larvae TaxID=1464 RepID=UPI0037C7C0AA